MSANLKKSFICSLSAEEDDPHSNSACFNLDKEDQFGIFFNEKAMCVDLDDLPDRLFLPLSSGPEEVLERKPSAVKQEENSEIDYIYSPWPSVPEGHQVSPLVGYSQSVKKLQEKCRIVEKIIFATSKEPIFSYDIGFESETEEQDD